MHSSGRVYYSNSLNHQLMEKKESNDTRKNKWNKKRSSFPRLPPSSHSGFHQGTFLVEREALQVEKKACLTVLRWESWRAQRKPMWLGKRWQRERGNYLLGVPLKVSHSTKAVIQGSGKRIRGGRPRTACMRTVCIDLITWFFLTSIVNYTDWFLVIKPTLHSWDKQPLIIMYYPFYILMELICKI